MAEPIKRVLDSLIEGWGGDKRRVELEIWQAWNQVVGKMARRHTRPVEFKSHQLTVLVDGSSWLYQLSLFKRLILKKLKKRLRAPDDIKEIIFRIGKIGDGQEN